MLGMNLGHTDTPIETQLDVRDLEATPDSSPQLTDNTPPTVLCRSSIALQPQPRPTITSTGANSMQANKKLCRQKWIRDSELVYWAKNSKCMQAKTTTGRRSNNFRFGALCCAVLWHVVEWNGCCLRAKSTTATTFSPREKQDQP